MKYIILVCLALCLVGCDDDRKPEYPVEPVNDAQMQAVLGPAPTTVTEVDNRVKVLEGALKILATERRDIIVAARQTKLYWLSGILGFAAVGLGIAAWFSPFFRTTLILAAAGCAAFATILLYVARWAAYFEWIGAGLLLASAATVILLWRNKAHALTVLATHFTAYADKLGAIAPEARAELDRISLDAQAATPTVKATVDKALSTVSAKL